VNLPAGMTIMTGQPLAHSMKSEPGSPLGRPRVVESRDQQQGIGFSIRS
jgi:hypothetical protein